MKKIEDYRRKWICFPDGNVNFNAQCSDIMYLVSGSQLNAFEEAVRKEERERMVKIIESVPIRAEWDGGCVLLIDALERWKKEEINKLN